MPRSSKRIVAPLFLLLVAFVPEVRGDTLNFNYGDGTWTWTMAQDAVPDRGSVASGDFQFNNVPVFVAFWDRVQTFDMHFFTLSYLASPVTRNLQMNCDPFRIVFDPISLTCDYSNWIQIEGDSGMWMAGADGNPAFIPGDWNGLIISETPEPSTLALLFATLFLLAVGVRPSHR